MGPADERESERLMWVHWMPATLFFDTAAMYGMGHSEELIGRTFPTGVRSLRLPASAESLRERTAVRRLIVAPDVLRKTCEDSLRRLQTDVIDLYYLHRIDPGVPVEESVGTLSELVSEGKIKTIGLSEGFDRKPAQSACRTSDHRAAIGVFAVGKNARATNPRCLQGTWRDLRAFLAAGRSFLTGKSQDITNLPDDDIRATNR